MEEFCKEFSTFTEATNGYPGVACKECKNNVYDPEEGIQTCQIIKELVDQLARGIKK